MKKIFLIFVATVVLSSLAFAKPYGEKSRADSGSSPLRYNQLLGGRPLLEALEGDNKK